MAPPPVEFPYAPASTPCHNESANRRMKQPREAKFQISVFPGLLNKDKQSEKKDRQKERKQLTSGRRFTEGNRRSVNFDAPLPHRNCRGRPCGRATHRPGRSAFRSFCSKASPSSRSTWRTSSSDLRSAPSFGLAQPTGARTPAIKTSDALRSAALRLIC